MSTTTIERPIETKTGAVATVPVLPDSAPFSPAQRAWLNGFFAGMFGGSAPRAPENSAAPSRDVEVAQPAPPAEEEFPWHDPAIPLDERLKLAEDKPRERVQMA